MSAHDIILPPLLSHSDSSARPLLASADELPIGLPVSRRHNLVSPRFSDFITRLVLVRFSPEFFPNSELETSSSSSSSAVGTFLRARRPTDRPTDRPTAEGEDGCLGSPSPSVVEKEGGSDRQGRRATELRFFFFFFSVLIITARRSTTCASVRRAIRFRMPPQTSRKRAKLIQRM